MTHLRPKSFLDSFFATLLIFKMKGILAIITILASSATAAAVQMESRQSTNACLANGALLSA